MPPKNDRLKKIEQAYAVILENLDGDHLDAETRRKTPRRAARALLELTGGYKQDADQIVNGAYYPARGSSMVLVRDISFHSLCTHHLLPFIGSVHAAYLPGERIIGLSKIPRLVNLCAHRLQVQEHLTIEIADLLMDKLQARGVGVVIEATHLCAMLRGVRDCSASLVTRAFRGAFADDAALRGEFLQSVRSARRGFHWDERDEKDGEETIL